MSENQPIGIQENIREEEVLRINLEREMFQLENFRSAEATTDKEPATGEYTADLNGQDAAMLNHEVPADAIELGGEGENNTELGEDNCGDKTELGGEGGNNTELGDDNNGDSAGLETDSADQADDSSGLDNATGCAAAESHSKNPKKRKCEIRLSIPEDLSGSLQCRAKCSSCGKVFRALVSIDNSSQNDAEQDPLNIQHQEESGAADTASGDDQPSSEWFSDSEVAELDIKEEMSTEGFDPQVCEVVMGRRGKSASLTSRKRGKLEKKLNRKVNKKQKCSICGKCFSDNSSLNAHMRIHAINKPYNCDICGNDYTTTSSLNAHRKIHTGENPVSCYVCGKQLSGNSSLKRHLRVHTGEKPFKCNICGNDFSEKVNLTNHMNVHTGERPYKCDVCEKCFTQSSSLLVHKRIHSGIKPFKCEVCGKDFTQNYALVLHKRNHTGENKKPFPCDICEKSFSRSSLLISHKRMHACDGRWEEIS